MADEKAKDELSEKELDAVSGGLNAPAEYGGGGDTAGTYAPKSKPHPHKK